MGTWQPPIRRLFIFGTFRHHAEGGFRSCSGAAREFTLFVGSALYAYCTLPDCRQTLFRFEQGCYSLLKPRRLRPADARMMASNLPSSSLLKRVFTLPRKDLIFRSAAVLRSGTGRRRLEVPSTAPLANRPGSCSDLRKSVTRIFLSRITASVQPFGQIHRHILHRVNCNIRTVAQHSLFQLLDEQPPYCRSSPAAYPESYLLGPFRSTPPADLMLFRSRLRHAFACHIANGDFRRLFEWSVPDMMLVSAEDAC